MVEELLKLFLAEFHIEFGEDAQIELGERYSILLNDGVAILTYDEGGIHLDVLAGEPYKIDYTLGL